MAKNSLLFHRCAHPLNTACLSGLHVILEATPAEQNGQVGKPPLFQSIRSFSLRISPLSGSFTNPHPSLRLSVFVALRSLVSWTLPPPFYWPSRSPRCRQLYVGRAR